MPPEQQNDPIVLYLIVREELNMSIGKTAAQVGHGVQYVLMHYVKACALKAKMHDDNLFPKDEQDHIKLTTEWLGHGSTKIVLKADNKEWETLKAELGNSLFLVRDNGLTELTPGTETVMALSPLRKSTVPNRIRRLQVL
jgi:peptidyl-tRNA hydrolase, PTH2 family